jgi:hypothetical protein
MKILITIGIIVVILVVRLAHAKKRREKLFAENFPKFKNLVAEGKYSEAWEMLTKTAVLIDRCKLEPEQRKDIMELEIECLEKLNEIPKAVVSLAAHLATVYYFDLWPIDLFKKWISLYKSCDPIPIEKFYFCRECGVHPETEALLKYAIEKEGCLPPVGFPGRKGSGVIAGWGAGKKFEYKEK